jgi:hypothetical protein
MKQTFSVSLYILDPCLAFRKPVKIQADAHSSFVSLKADKPPEKVEAILRNQPRE